MAKIPKRRRRGQLTRKPKTLAQYQALPPRSQAALENSAHVVTRMRGEGLSLNRAAAEYGTDPRTVVRLAGSALRKSGGRYAAKPSDNLFRELIVPVHGGTQVIGVRGSRAASALSDRLNAQRLYVSTGDASMIAQLQQQTLIDADGHYVPFLTDLDELDRLADLGFLSYESIYARR